MKLSNIYRIYASAALAAAIATPAVAQNLQSGYFDENYQYRFQLNPAFGGTEEHGFVAMPGLGNLNVSTEGNVGVNHFLYNVDGRTTTFLNPKVDATEFLNGVKNKNRLGVDLRETVLAFGFKGMGGYNTFSLSARANVGVFLPKELLRLFKQGAENRSYNIGNIGAQATAWAEIALNHSHQISEQWRVGGTFKVLLGGGNIDARFYNANLTLGEDSWTATVDAEMHNSVRNLNYKMDYNENTHRHYVSGFDYDKFGLNGAGAAFDLGGVFTLNSDWEFSASVLDLGFITWDGDFLATTSGIQQVETDNYSFNVDDMDNAWDKMRDDLSMLYQLENAGDQGARTTMLGTTLNFAAKYTLPVYRNLNFGVMSSTRIQGKYSWTDFRLSANIQPVKCLSAGVNFGIGTFGPSLGWIVDLKTTGFGFFIASDVTPGKLAKQGVPLNSNLNLNLGINFPF